MCELPEDELEENALLTNTLIQGRPNAAPFLPHGLAIHPKYAIEERNDGSVNPQQVCVQHEMMRVVWNHHLLVGHSRLFQSPYQVCRLTETNVPIIVAVD